MERCRQALGPELRERLVFVGGCTTAFFVTDPITLEGVRNTDDVDLIVDLSGPGKWPALVEALNARGFRESAEDDVVCRFRLDGLRVDVMPDDEGVLGFSNRWYSLGMEPYYPRGVLRDWARSQRGELRSAAPAAAQASTRGRRHG